MKFLKSQLMSLLLIQAPSGHERKVSNYLMPRLSKLTDKCGLDHYGNLLAEKVVGDGKGATIILSAHMDTVSNIAKGRKIIENNGVYSVTKGVLGADDRAGIAIILAVLRNIDKTSFNGTIKVAFSRQEEVGCVGAGQIDPRWYEGSDLAIVVDRKGNRDIVTGCWQPFCSTEVGLFFEECGAMLNMDWVAREGGISDATTFSEGGVNSVNLSAGYFNEHTEKEVVNINFMKDTVNLILQAFALVNQFSHSFGEVPASNKWVDDWSNYNYNKDSKGSFANSSLKGQRGHEFYVGSDTFGEVQATTFDEFVSLYQMADSGDQEVLIHRDSFIEICDSFMQMEYGISMKDIDQMIREDAEVTKKHKAVVGA